MKNMFGKPKQRPSQGDPQQKHIELLEKRVLQLQIELEEQRKALETRINSEKITESQKQEEDLKQEKKTLSENNETINHEEISDSFNEPEYIILSKPTAKRQKVIDILEKEAVKAVHTNHREIIKSKIEEELRAKELSAKELKILFVDEYEYCSKATFYRYLESLRKEQRIDSIKINGKEYLCSIPSKINNKTTF